VQVYSMNANEYVQQTLSYKRKIMQERSGVCLLVALRALLPRKTAVFIVRPMQWAAYRQFHADSKVPLSTEFLTFKGYGSSRETYLRASPVIWDHTVLPATRHRWMRPLLTPAGNRFTNRGKMEGWADFVAGYRDGLRVTHLGSKHLIALIWVSTKTPLISNL